MSAHISSNIYLNDKSDQRVPAPPVLEDPTEQRRPISLPALVTAPSLRDLTDPRQGPHAIQVLVADAVAALARLWDCEAVVDRAHPIVTVNDNYDHLGYPCDAIARDGRYTRYVSETTMLRSHTSAGVPAALRRLASMNPEHQPDRVLLALPGMVYRRDSIDRLHTGTPHQLDLWLLQRTRRTDHDDLHEMVSALAGTMLPGRHWRWTAAEHPYTEGGREVDVISDGQAVEVAECGLAASGVLAAAGLDPARWSGLALGMGLDRILMLRKGIPDIRLLRSTDPRVGEQMLDLSPYQPMSDLPVARRDLSVVSEPDTDDEILGDQIRDALGGRAEMLEEVTIISLTEYGDLPDAARSRLRIRPGQVNLLVRLVLRPLERTLTSVEANDLRDETWSAIDHSEGWR